MKNKILGVCIFILLITAVVLPASGIMNKRELLNDKAMTEFAPGEFIVKVKQDTAFSNPALIALNKKYQAYAVDKIFPNAEGTILDNVYLLHVPVGSDILLIVQNYASCPDVVYAEPNGVLSFCIIPNDTNFSKQWSLHNTGQVFQGSLHGTPDADIDAPEAWEIETGSLDVVIANIDTGIDYTHPDLAAKIWNNTDEISGNDIDDDHNGYIDDIRGWDFFYNDSNVTDGEGHGTMIAGVIAASTNNSIGIAGVTWNSIIMPVRTTNETGWSSYTFLAQGIKYAADNGADIINIEAATYSPSGILLDAVNYAYDNRVFLCAPAGNSNSQHQFYPAAYENVTGVAATDQDDTKASFSNYGEWVDIAAPGNKIFSTMPTYHCYENDLYGVPQNYSFGTGTSMAAPMVAGVAALLLSKDPSLTNDEVKTLLCENVDPYNSTEYIGTGRLNAQKALIALNQPPTPPIITGPINGKKGQYYPYTFVSTDPEGNNVSYYVDWGDDTNTGWIGPYASGIEIVVNHIWDDRGTYTIKGKARDVNGNESAWSTLRVTMPLSYEQPQFPFFVWLFERFLNAFPILRQLLGL